MTSDISKKSPAPTAFSGKNALIFLAAALVISAVTFCGGLLSGIDSGLLRASLRVLLYLVMGGAALAALKLSHMTIDFEWANPRQYLIGLLVCVGLSLVVGWIPALCGFSLIGGHQEFALLPLVHDLLFYLLLVGPAEELIFRVYLQGLFTGWFRRRPWIGVLLASLLFGAWHLINGFLLQGIFTFLIGCVFGFSRQYLRELHFPGLALCHGLYDFLNDLVRILVL